MVSAGIITASGLLLLVASASALQTHHPAPTTQTTRRGTSLSNMLRDYADYGYSNDPYSRSERSGASSTNWRKNQGYNLNRPTPPEIGGSVTGAGSMRDAEVNPYYDPGWAQSIRRDNPSSSRNYESASNYNGYDDPYAYGPYLQNSHNYPSTFPGMTTPQKTARAADRAYRNPTNPYYEPLWSQGYVDDREPIREGDHAMYYAPGYEYSRNGFSYMGRGGGYYGGRGGAYYAVAVPPKSGAGRKVFNGNSFMRSASGLTRSTRPGTATSLRMSFYDAPPGMGYDGPFYDPSMMGPLYPPPNMPGGGMGMMPPQRGLRELAADRDGVFQGTGGPMGANQQSQNFRRRGGRRSMAEARGMRQRQDGMGGRTMGGYGGGGMGRDSFGMRGGGGPMDQRMMDPRMRGPMGGGPGGPFGRDSAVARMSLKDMAARTTMSYDAEVISSMNRASPSGQGGDGAASPGQEGGVRGNTLDPTNRMTASSEFVPLSAIYGPGGTAAADPPGPTMDRSPPLTNAGPPLPPPVIDTRARAVADDVAPPRSPLSSPQSTVKTARVVRPSVALVTSKGVRKESSQGSGFVVAFDDAVAEAAEGDEDVDRCHVLTSAHVAPPGWKVSVTFPSDPEREYPATVVGRKLMSDLALLSVECPADDGEDYPFPPPLILSADNVSSGPAPEDDGESSSEIGSPVYSFGYPMGVEGPSITSGILSATTRGINYMDAPTGEEPGEVAKTRPFENTSFLITDAAMAGGMSGGPLVNADGIVLAINALVRPDLRALGHYAVSAVECETFLERLEEQRAKDAASKGDDAPSSTTATTARRQRTTSRRVASSPSAGNSDDEEGAEQSPPGSEDDGTGVAGYRVMLYGYSTSKSDATKALRRAAGLDELRAESAMRSAYSFGAGVVDEFYVREPSPSSSGGKKSRDRAVRAARKSADELKDKLREEGMMVEVEPLNLLS